MNEPSFGWNHDLRLDPKRNAAYRRLAEKLPATRLVELNGLGENGNRIFLKLETECPTGSPFDRLYPSLFYQSEARGTLVFPHSQLVECSIGSAGASFAFTARELGFTRYRVLALKGLPPARIELMRRLGADVELIDGDGPKAYVDRLEAILAESKKTHGRLGEDPERVVAMTKIQAGSSTMMRRIGDEIQEQMGELGLVPRHFVNVIGSGSTVTEVGSQLRTLYGPRLRIHAVETVEVPQVSAFREGRGPIGAPKGWLETGPIGSATWGLPLEKLHVNWDLLDDEPVIRCPARVGDTYRDLINAQFNLGVGRVTGLVVAASVVLSRRTGIENSVIIAIATCTDWKWSDRVPAHVAERLELDVPRSISPV